MLTPKQQRFVAEYLVDMNATRAAIAAGYSPKAARAVASRLLTNANVASAIATGKAKQLEKADLSATRILEELRRLALCDTRGFFDDKGNLKPMSELTPEQGAALAGVDVIIKNAKAGDGQTDEIHKIKLWDKTRALDTLAKHFGLLKERVEHEGEISIRWAE